MSTEIICQTPPGGQGWTMERGLQNGSSTSEISHSAAELRSKLLRPKMTSCQHDSRIMSVPPSLQRSFTERQSSVMSSPAPPRPHTALGMSKTDCERVYQIEKEPTRKHNLESHLPIRKPKPQPWQKQLDRKPPLVPQVIAPGYVLSKSKSKIAMHIKTEDFFDPDFEEKTSIRRGSPERDALIDQLQQQISDLQLFLEEERFEHRQTRIQAAEQLKETMNDMTVKHKQTVKKIHEQHEDELAQLTFQHQQELADERTRADSSISKMRGEIEFLHGAFESYKSRLHQENIDRWKKQEHDLKIKHEEEMQQKLHEIRSRMIAERNNEKAESNKEHQKEIQNLRKEHKKEMDSLIRRFSNAAADLQRLKETEAELEKTKAELEEVTKQYDDACRQVTDLTRELTETTVRLITFEQDFQRKVQSVDDQYRDEINNLRTQNAEIRRLYMKKCGELLTEKEVSDNVRTEQLETAKSTMKMLIETRNRTLVNLAAHNPDIQETSRKPKERPSSAPLTRRETSQAHMTAGETDNYVQKKEEELAFSRPETARPRFLAQLMDQGGQ